MKSKSIVKDSSSEKTVFLKSRPKVGKLAYMIILYGRKLNSKGQLNNKRQLNDEGQLNNTGQLVNKNCDVFWKSRPKAGKLAY